MSISSLCDSGTLNGSKSSPSRGPSPRLLFLASPKSQGGIERHSMELAAALQARGVPLQFACPPGSYLDKHCRERGLPTLPFQVRNSGDLTAALRLAQLIRLQGIDIVHAHSRRDYVIAVLGVALARRILHHRPTLILHAHMIRSLGDLPRLSRIFFEWGVDAVVAVSGAVADRLRYDHNLNPALVHLIYNGINVDQFAVPGSLPAAVRRRQTRREWNISKDTLVLGMVGRLDAKGQAYLLEAAPALLKQHPSLRIVLIGAEGRSGEKARLVAQATTAGLARHLIFTDSRDDIPALLPGLDVLVHLPRDESFGLALAEAMAVGLPTIATAIGGCREVVRDSVTGFLVPPGDAAALTAALLRLLDPETGPELRTTMGLAGREIVEKNFSGKRQIDLLQALYQELCPHPTS